MNFSYLLNALPGEGIRKWLGLPFFVPGYLLLFLSGLISGEHSGGRLARVRSALALPFVLISLGFLFMWHVITPGVWPDIELDDQGD